jgi:hypothetical protein
MRFAWMAVRQWFKQCGRRGRDETIAFNFLPLKKTKQKQTKQNKTKTKPKQNEKWINEMLKRKSEAFQAGSLACACQ